MAEKVERRLAAILSADVVGYSSLMGADEEGTLAPFLAVFDTNCFAVGPLATRRNQSS